MLKNLGNFLKTQFTKSSNKDPDNYYNNYVYSATTVSVEKKMFDINFRYYSPFSAQQNNQENESYSGFMLPRVHNEKICYDCESDNALTPLLLNDENCDSQNAIDKFVYAINLNANSRRSKNVS